MPMQMGMPIDSRQFNFVRELLTRLYRPTRNELDRIERSVRAGFMQNFARQSVGGGAPWASLADRTRRERVFQGYNATNPILRRRNVYAESWTRVGGWRMFVYSPVGWTLHIASDHKWAFTHELGNRGRAIPARAVRYLDGGQQRVVASAVESWVDSVIRSVMT